MICIEWTRHAYNAKNACSQGVAGGDLGTRGREVTGR
jgi:hypothetical protein